MIIKKRLEPKQKQFIEDFIFSEFKKFDSKYKTETPYSKEDFLNFLNEKNVMQEISRQLENFANSGLISNFYLILKLKKILDLSMETVDVIDKQGTITDKSPRNLVTALKCIDMIAKIATTSEYSDTTRQLQIIDNLDTKMI